MRRQVLLEKSIFDTFLSSRCDGNSYGILIGQNSPTNKVDHIFLPLETPVHENNNDDQNAEWIAKHALNVYRMLPGTFYVRGFYVFQDDDWFNANIHNLRKVLFNIHNQQAAIEDPLLHAIPLDQYLLLIHPTSKDLQCYNMQCTSIDSEFHPITVRCKTFIDRWVKLSTRINIVLDTTLPKERTKEKILKEFQTAARPFLSKVKHNSCLLVNGESLSLDEPVLSPCASEDSSSYEPQRSMQIGNSIRRGSLGADSGAGDDAASGMSGDSIFSSHYSPHPHLSLIGIEVPDLGYTSSEEDEPLVPITHLRVQGRVPALTFLPENSSVGTVQEALQEDIIRSVHTRLDLLTDELQVMGGELQSSHLLLPQRVLINLPICPRLPLSDYKFLSETIEDVVSRVRFLCRTTSRSAQLRGSVAEVPCSLESPLGGLFHAHSSSGHDTPTSIGSGGTDIASEIDEHCIDNGLEVTASAVSEELTSNVGVMEDIEKVTTRVANNRWRIIWAISLLILLLAVISCGFLSFST